MKHGMNCAELELYKATKAAFSFNTYLNTTLILRQYYVGQCSKSTMNGKNKHDDRDKDTDSVSGMK